MTADAGRPPPLPLSLQTPAAHPFVGRAAALASLERSWPLAGSGGQIVLIGGEAGSGKTRLTAEFARLVHRSGAAVLLGSCDDDLAVPYQPWVQAVEQLLAVLPTRAMTGELAPLSPLLAHGERVAHDRDVLPGDPDAARYRLYEAFGVAFREAATRWPTVVVLEDLHWAGVQTLALLRHVARSGLPSGLLVVGTFRDTSDEITEPLAACLADLRRTDAVTRLRLGGLDGEAVERFVAEAIGHPLDARFKELAAELADAQPGERLLPRRAVATPRRQWSGRGLGGWRLGRQRSPGDRVDRARQRPRGGCRPPGQADASGADDDRDGRGRRAADRPRDPRDGARRGPPTPSTLRSASSSRRVCSRRSDVGRAFEFEHALVRDTVEATVSRRRAPTRPPRRRRGHRAVPCS